MSITKDGKDWSAVWLARYRQFSGVRESSPFPTNRDSLTRFLRSLLDSGKPAWQRLQAVQARHHPGTQG